MVSNEGREFYYAVVAGYQSVQSLVLYVTTAHHSPVAVTVQADGLRRPLGNFQVRSGDVYKFEIPTDLAVEGTTKVPNAIRMTAATPVTVFSSSRFQGCGASVVYPTRALGKAYYTMHWKPSRADPVDNAVIVIVAVRDNTIVRVFFESADARVRYGGEVYGAVRPLTLTLNRNDVLQVVDTGRADLTRTGVLANEPVAVFSGNTYATIGTPSNADAIYEQMPPIDSYGMKYVIIPVPNRSVGDKIKIVANILPTRVTISGLGDFMIDSITRFREWDIPSNQYVSIIADNPVLVAQFISSSVGSDPGYPSMVMVPAVDQFRDDYRFVVPDLAGATVYLMIALPREFTSGLILDDTAVPHTGWQSVPGQYLKLLKATLINKSILNLNT